MSEISVKIREIEDQDLEATSAICMGSFSKSVAGALSKEGVSTFSKIASSDALRARMKEDNALLVRMRRTGRGCNRTEARPSQRYAFCRACISKERDREKLLASALSFARVDTVIVRASLYSVPIYEKSGFELKLIFQNWPDWCISR